MATLDLNNLTKSFGSAKVLHGIDLAIRDKEFVVFVGPSGCGKSTLLRIIAGLEAATSGKIVIDGEDVSALAPVDRGIAMVFQSYALYPHLTVFENIAFPLRVQKLPEPEVRAKVGKAADILQLTDKLGLKPGQLSGGQRQRVAIGRSIVRNPKVFLFDEPLSNLDAALRGDMRVELSQLHRDLAATMIYVTHDQIEAMTMAHRIVVLNKGRIEQFGTPMELYHHPATRFVATFIGQPNMNLVPARVIGIDAQGLAVEFGGGHRLVLPVDTATAKLGDTVEVGIRPENAALGAGLSIKVRVLERLGGVSILYGNTADGLRFCASLPGDCHVAEGETIGLSINPADCHVFDASGAVMRRRMAPATTPALVALRRNECVLSQLASACGPVMS
jgi:multiple sugar transport system ATP-binding protein